ncbi:MAG: redox-regulated ATPase YchF [Thermomicrobiales bacterium]
MSLRLVIVGLPSSGKTTVFNALTRASAATGAYTSAEDQPNLATVKVPDQRLEVLANMFKPKKVVPADVQYVDVAGLAKGMAEQGLSGQLLGHLAQGQALVHVVRAFQDANVPHPEETVDPLRDIETINLEFMFSDLGIIEKRLQRITATIAKTRGPEREANEREAALLTRLHAALEEGTPIRNLDLDEDEQKVLRGFGFLTGKPLLILLNLGEEQLGAEGEQLVEAARARFSGPQIAIDALAGKIEAELAQLEPADAAEFMADLGIAESGLDRVIALSYRLLGLISFLTAGPDECRAWTIPAGSSAVDAAGAIHSDLARGFIRAEVVAYDDLIAAGSLPEARKRGVLRAEGRTYTVKDGDVIEILFNV